MSPFVKAKRIWSGGDGPNQYARFKDSFELSGVARRAVLRIRADNKYSVTLNGTWLAAQQYSDYAFFPVYDEIELPEGLLRSGTNRIEILAYCQNESSFSYRKGEPSLIFELEHDGEIVAYSSEQTLVTQDTEFKSGEVEKITSQLSYSFVYDSRRAEAARYVNASVLEDIRFEYVKRAIPQLTVSEPLAAQIIAQGAFIDAKRERSGESVFYDYLSARRLAEMSDGGRELPSKEGVSLACEDGDGIYALIDLGRESAGYLLFDIEVEDDCRIVCGYGEHLGDLRVRSTVKTRNFAFTVNAKKGRNTVFWPIKRLGARYLQLHAACHKLKLYYVGLRSVDYPFGEVRVPEGLNTLQREIYSVAVNTLRLCAHEHYEDTPWREQGLYAMDSRNQMMFCHLAFGETLLTKEGLRLLALGQKEYGLLELCAPAEAPDRVNIPCFSLVWLCALKEYFDRTGDIAFVGEMLPYAERILAFFDQYTANNSLVVTPTGYWNFYEWAPMLTGSAKAPVDENAAPLLESPLNAFYIMALRAYTELGEANGANMSTAHERISKMEQSYEDVFYSPERCAYRLSDGDEGREVYPELVQALSVLSGVCKSRQTRRAILQGLVSREFSPTVTLSHRIYLYQALLSESDMKEEVLADVERHWLPMLRQGATSFWETELGADDFGGAGSLCHGWSAAPIWVYWRCLGK